MKKPTDHKKKPQVGDYTYGEITIPSLNKLMTFGFSRTHRHLTAEEQIYTLLEDNVDEETLAKIDELDRSQTQEFIEGWQEHAGIDVGESAAS